MSVFLCLFHYDLATAPLMETWAWASQQQSHSAESTLQITVFGCSDCWNMEDDFVSLPASLSLTDFVFYCLSALSQIMLFVDGMNGVINHNETVQWLYTLTGSLVSVWGGISMCVCVSEASVCVNGCVYNSDPVCAEAELKCPWWSEEHLYTYMSL